MDWRAAAFLVLVVGVGASGCAKSTATAPVRHEAPSAAAASGPVTPPGVVPWADRPAPPEPAASYPPPPHAPACQPGQLRVATVQGGALAGDTLIGVVTATNVGRTVCSLVGTPSAAGLVTTSGRTVPVRLASGRLPGGADSDLPPGDQARLTVEYEGGGSPGCAAIWPRALRLTLPSGGTVEVVKPLFPTVSCPALGVGAFYVRGADVPLPMPLDALRVTLHVPATVRAGTVLAYTVTLSNPTSGPIGLVPCPGYWAHGFVNGESVVHDQLNCDGHTAIAAGQSLTFAMRIPVPDQADPGAPLYWHLDTPVRQDGGSPGYREATAGIVVTAPLAQASR